MTRDTNRPFYVVTDAVRVKVYGTEFNVNTYGIGGTQTTLVSGKVGIRGKGSGREYMMEPSQLAEFDVNGEFKGIRNVNAGTYTAWKEGVEKTSVRGDMKVEGFVQDKDGEPIVGATVLIEGTNMGTVTDVDGRFVMSASKEDKLVVSYIGMKGTKVKVASKVTITLKDE